MMETLLSSPLLMAFLPYLNAIATAMAVFAVGLPLSDYLENRERIKFVALDRASMRKRQSELNAASKNAHNNSLRVSSPGALARAIVNKLDLKRWLNAELDTERLSRAGFRGLKAETTFLIVRLLMPIGAMFLATILVSAVMSSETSLSIKGLIFTILAYFGYKLPEFYVTDVAKNRRVSMQRAFPDAMDLLLICIETGMSIEQSFRKVSQEIGNTSIPLAEELLLTTAELSFLPDRRQAYENLAKRTELDIARSLSTVLIQSERYGTSLGSALRVLSKDSRDARMIAAEKKAAGLSPKLTVPMILFFLPALFIIILSPAVIQIFKWN